MTDSTKQDNVLTKVMWNTQVLAPTHYPIELVAGESFWFFDEMGDERVGFYAQAGGGWRNGAVDTIGGSPSSPTFLPVGVKLMWLSFAESCFYHAVLPLPIQSLQALAEQTLDTNKQVIKNLITIQFAIAPHGFVSLRAGFGNHIQELSTHKAEMANASWEFFALTNHFSPDLMTMEQYIAKQLVKAPKAVQEQIKNGNLPTRWQEYSERKFAWHIACDVALFAHQVIYVNGESSLHLTSADKQSTNASPKLQPAPAWIELFFRKNNQRHYALVNLSHHQFGKTEQPEDDVAVFEVFKGFFSSNRPTALVINLTKDMADTVFLTNGHKEQALDAHIITKTLADDEYPWFK
ncbi:DUF2931 family protein [Moraxella bovis]|uniref:DUF2931 family protein n=1 Tax=Moraxella bovis TaxID=476 RepID=A0AAX3ETH2_MORBO|nr:DUF2931 family protein [Moraxella bovis]AWY21182.1 DUF2931 family protein [Moraxella bovis]OOR87816.1 hypothetical protein B0182_11295 [Moraxella bovis]UYZ89129.1 DUF2931 family protein [Moraxella bovis]UZA03599.1 DUF2931 family protein [Moraxella bovis]UZA05853.1 DUF2931 family protein [Moraxella bovis]